MSQFEVVIWKTISSVERHFHITEAAGQIVTSRSMEWNENHPRKLTLALENKSLVASENLLSSTYAGWDSGTGAVDYGDRVDYYVYPESDPTTKTRVFWGIITEISQTNKGILTIVARDYLEKYEYIHPNIVIYGNYLDQEHKDTTEGDGATAITGCSETGIAWPPVAVGLARTDVTTTLSGTGTNLDPLMEMDPGTADPYVPDAYEWFSDAQSFVALGNGLIGVQYYYQSWDITVDGHIKCAIQADADGVPSGSDLASREDLVGIGTNVNTPVQVDFTAVSGNPVRLITGNKYWVVFSCDNTIRGTEYTDGGVSIIWHSGVPANPYSDHYWWCGLDPEVAWTESTADRNLTVRLDFADYEDVAPEDYYQSGTSIICNNRGVPITTTSSAYYSGTIHRGRVSYYYSPITTEHIFEDLIALDSDMTESVDADCDTTFPIYQTRGKSAGECIRELCDTFETTGSRSGYQHAVAAYHSVGGTDYIKVGFRPYTGSQTFACGRDSTTDDELRINSVNLRRTTSQRPASVIVKGKTPSGAPIIVQRDDRALATSFRTQSKLALTLTYTDESIRTLLDADRKAWQLLDSYARGEWEGSIVVAGIYPDLFDLDTASETYGAGGHIHLKYSPLGITSATAFHVTGILLRENTTEIQITNKNILLLNRLTDSRGRAERSESFIAPDDPLTTVFVAGYSATVETAATMYMQLATADETGMDNGYRVLCTRTSMSRYNDSTYHAEFEMGNGHTVDGEDRIVQLELWDAASGGTCHAKVALSEGEWFPKWRTTRVIAEVHCEIA